MIGTTTPPIHPKPGPMTWWRTLPGTRNMNEIKWLFQLDDGSQIITMEKWLEITMSLHPLQTGCLG